MQALLSSLWSFFIDLIFPPSIEDLELRALSITDLFEKLPKAPFPSQPYITSVFAYKNKLVSALVWHIKYKKDRHAIECGGFALHKKLREMNLQEVILVPIPISKKR